MSVDTAAGDPIVAIERDFGYLWGCGPAARRWLAVQTGVEAGRLRAALATALQQVRRYDLAAARELYATVGRDLRLWADRHPANFHLMERYRLAGLAYCDYLSGDLAAAKDNLLRAHHCVELAIGDQECLLPLAVHCTDFIIQRARIARRECDWREAQQQIDKIRAIYADDRPYCTLPSGRPVRVSDLRRFYAALPLEVAQRDHAAKIVGDEWTVTQRIELLEEAVYALPDMVIPYP